MNTSRPRQEADNQENAAMSPHARYPALMAYIDSRNGLESTASWCDQLRHDEAAAFAGELADVAAELARAKEDFGTAQRANGRSDYPYNRDMGLFLGLTLKANGEPGPGAGYYMATHVETHHRLGEATRQVQWLIDPELYVLGLDTYRLCE